MKKVSTHWSPSTASLIKMLILRMLVPLSGMHHFIGDYGLKDNELVEFLDLTDLESSEEEFNQKEVKVRLRNTYEAYEKEFNGKYIPDEISHFIALINNNIGLSDAEEKILSFMLMCKQDNLLETSIDYLGKHSFLKLKNTLSFLLDIEIEQINHCLSRKGKLISSGLIELDCNSLLDNCFEFFSNPFVDESLCKESTIYTLLRGRINKPPKSTLNRCDYIHYEDEINLITKYLSNGENKNGVNIFIYGEPGTGKSELARFISEELQKTLYEVAISDEDGDPITGSDRLKACRLAQNLLGNKKSILVFDEVQDILDDAEYLFSKSTAETHKGWFNRLLEENVIPTIWIANHCSYIDQAILRRFDLIFELNIPLKPYRERIVKKYCGNKINTSLKKKILNNGHISPALISQAVKVVEQISDPNKNDYSKYLETVIDNKLSAQGYECLNNEFDEFNDIYDIELSNTNESLSQIARGLKSYGQGKICLYGPPGTGKTAFAKWIAEYLGKSLFEKKTSELLSMWVGGSEKNIANTFKSAKRENAVLLIDEAESLLRTREHADKSWEITQVNEMLKQMESFSGVFVASTNLVDILDKASLRRFDFTIKFDYLSPNQTSKLFKKTCAILGLEDNDENVTKKISQLTTLAPGDFIQAIRKGKIIEFKKTEDLYNSINSSTSYKQANPIGFLH